MSLLKDFLRPFAAVVLVTVSCSGAEKISLSPGIGSCVEAAAAQNELLPAKTPEFSLQIFGDYFKVTLKVPVVRKEKVICAGKKHDDERMFSGHVAEFFIAPEAGNNVYYHIAANPAGLIYTAKGRDISWNPEIKSNVSRDEKSWTAELIIPYKEINTAAPIAATIWRADFAATVKVGAIKKPCNWSGARKFHNPAEFGTISFDDRTLPEITVWEADNDMIKVALRRPEQYANCQAYCEVNGKKYPFAQKDDLLVWQIPVRQDYVFSRHSHLVKFSLVSPDGKLVYSRTGKAEPAVQKDLLIDSFYYTPDMQTLTYKQTFAPDARILLKNSDGQLIADYAAKSSGQIPLSGLAPGRYVVELTAGDQWTSRYIRIVPQNFTAPSIADSDRFEIRNNLFFLNGTPIFLVGGSVTNRNHLQFKDVFNIANGNIGNLPNAVGIKNLGGMRLLRTPFLCRLLHRDIDRIITRVMSEDPAGNRQIWRLAYEAQIQLTTGSISELKKIDTARYYKELYQRLKKQYPERYFSIQIDQESCLPDFSGSCDILEFASWRSSYAVNMISNLDWDMKNMKRHVGNRPSIYWLGGSIPNPHCRLAEELRAAVYCAVINNINGVLFHLGHGGLGPERSRLWSLISGINAEIQPIYREFASGRELPGFVRELKGNFIWSARKCGNFVRMIVVNLASAEQMLDMKTAAGNVKLRLTPFEPVYLSFPFLPEFCKAQD